MASVDFTQNFTQGVDGEHYVPTTISAMGDAICKIAEQVIRSFTGKNPLSVFEKKPVNNGTTIEQMFVEMVAGEAYDASGASALTRKNPSLVVRYFDDWTAEKFHTSVDTSLIRKILTGEKSASDVAAKIVAVLGQSDIHTKYTVLKSLLKNARQVADGGQNTGGVASGVGASLIRAKTVAYDTVNSTINFDELLVSIRDIVDDMQFVNHTYNVAQIDKMTDKDNLVIVMPFYLKNRISVEKLAGVFNLSEAEIKDKMVIVDTPDETETSNGDTYYYNYIYILDKQAVLDYTRLYEMLSQLNADGRFWNYFLHTERMYGISPLFDACYIKVGTGFVAGD